MIDLSIHEVERLDWDKSHESCKTLVVTTTKGPVRIALFPKRKPTPPPSENDDEPRNPARA